MVAPPRGGLFRAGGKAGRVTEEERREVTTPEQPLAHGLVRGVRQCTADGPFTTTLQLYRVPVRCDDLDADPDFVWVQTLHGPGDAVPRSFTFPGAVRSDGLRDHACYTDARLGSRCQDAAVKLTLTDLQPGSHATGTSR